MVISCLKLGMFFTLPTFLWLHFLAVLLFAWAWAQVSWKKKAVLEVKCKYCIDKACIFGKDYIKLPWFPLFHYLNYSCYISLSIHDYIILVTLLWFKKLENCTMPFVLGLFVCLCGVVSCNLSLSLKMSHNIGWLWTSHLPVSTFQVLGF